MGQAYRPVNRTWDSGCEYALVSLSAKNASTASASLVLESVIKLSLTSEPIEKLPGGSAVSKIIEAGLRAGITLEPAGDLVVIGLEELPHVTLRERVGGQTAEEGGKVLGTQKATSATRLDSMVNGRERTWFLTSSVRTKSKVRLRRAGSRVAHIAAMQAPLCDGVGGSR